ncbi:hypothetical protein NEUTE1DRAFT_81692 [Neurospora tetrasperma FGSC 2508]|uniref:Homeobox domain-containing protein n=1 Tax=Neurospora tetrasperma (strain FGSC 2508 / ATCC MYA-4615 / P0657) TaxID=510951 RepID=F8MMC1_NEUT8|nr:uncharacterized protein NEUTE1DRAFT_81692 [Neurospora tetrasperma FGSC 2508]EGO57795.1 hypothetical protein NEUTE1DRAFT_81692 [Neurospora tetrasperma FGSC 2508]EGZ71933.1 hypothetical protein NEUTE2DRAFT_111033 [Neurospora tetrasperma FGSC 2509]
MSYSDSAYGSASESCNPATHDVSRVSYHVRHLETFAQALEELEDLEKCFREDYRYGTDIFAIPTENSHLELMLKIGDMIKQHEDKKTLFIVYYGGHARIDDSRQSTWCATRNPNSPWLQWSAIQTLLERSPSDVLILLDCCAGAASATFSSGQSITETISASTWDAIAPNPGRYSFTNALIEVLQEWRHRTFSAAMLHAEILARLKHPRPVLINGKHFESRSTPVHFMMTSNHKAPSIEIGRLVPDSRRSLSPYQQQHVVTSPRQDDWPLSPRSTYPYLPGMSAPMIGEPNEDEPHVMLSLALEGDQRLDFSAWEQWLASFPAIAKSNNLCRELGTTKSPHENDVTARNEEDEHQAMDADTESLMSEMATNYPGDTHRTDVQAASTPVWPPEQVSDPTDQARDLTREAIAHLEDCFRKDPQPSETIIDVLAFTLDVHPNKIKVWFDQRRQHEQTTLNLQGLHYRSSADQTPATKEGSARMILPGHLNTILTIYPHRGAVLLLDLRSSTDFEKSHISSAINLRCPVSFIQHASLEMIEDTFTDVSSRHSFNSWYQSRCVVLYDRRIEFDWECPIANALLTKFRGNGWKGQCFILKGHYREFADSFDKWITGKGKNTAEFSSGKLLESETSYYNDATEEEEQRQRRDREYERWLKEFDESGEGLGGRRITELGPAKREERARAVDQRQIELERELEARFPALWRKVVAIRGQCEGRAGGEGESLYSRHGGGPPTTIQSDEIGEGSVSPPQSPPPPPFSPTADMSVQASSGGQFPMYDKAQLVEPLVSGLQKMREASGLSLGLMSQDPAFAMNSSSHSQFAGDRGLGSTSHAYAPEKAGSYDQGGLTDDYNNYSDGVVDPVSESWQGFGGGMEMASGTVSPIPPEWQDDSVHVPTTHYEVSMNAALTAYVTHSGYFTRACLGLYHAKFHSTYGHCKFPR